MAGSQHPSPIDRRFEEAAVDLAERGYPVLPCKPHGKEPLTEHGWKDATRDERTILQWWDRWPAANIGVACGPPGIGVLDIDSKHGADPREVIPQLGLDGYPVIETGEAPERSEQYPNSLPGVRGAQVVFYGELPMPTGKTAIPGVEIRGEGAYVIAPPSVHPSGVPYEGDYPPVFELPVPPASVLAILAPAWASGSSAPTPDDDEPIEQGDRHPALLAWARSRYTAKGVLGQAALDGMRGHNARCCQPPLPDDEVVRLWRHLDGTRIAESERAKAAAEDEPSDGFATRALDVRAVRPITWAWEWRIPQGAVTILVGDEGQGKSTLLAWLLARLTRGELPGDLHGQPSKVLLVGDEDDVSDVWIPKLLAAGADLDLVRDLPPSKVGQLDVKRDIEALRAIVRAEGYSVVAFDALLDNLPESADEYKPRSVRAALQPLKRLAREERFAALGSLHTNKSNATTFRGKASMSHQFNAMARSGLLLARHPDDEDRCVVARGKGNWSRRPQSVAFAITSCEVAVNGLRLDVALAANFKPCDLTVEDLLGGDERRDKSLALDEAIEFLQTMLAKGPVPTEDVNSQARKLGIADATLRRARAQLGVEAAQKGRQWLMSLPLKNVSA